MSSRRQYHAKQRKQKKIVGWLMLAGGLLLMGVAAIFILPGADADAAAIPAVAGVPAPANVEYPAPELELSDLQGEAHSLAEYEGKVVLVNLWATWCPPCKQEMPDLLAYYEAHKSEGFIIIAIEDGSPTADVIAFAEERGLTFPVWLDPQYIATEKAFRAPGLPSTYVIDRDGVVRLQWSGALNLQALETYVTPMLGD